MYPTLTFEQHCIFNIYIYFLQYVFHQCWLLSRIFGSIYIKFVSCLLRLVSQLRMCFHQPISFVMWLQNMQNRSISSCIHSFYKRPSPQHATGYVTSLCWFCALHLSCVSWSALLSTDLQACHCVECYWLLLRLSRDCRSVMPTLRAFC